MRYKSFTQIASRTLDYLARRHPWFSAILRRRMLAVVALLGYGCFVMFLMWQVHGTSTTGWLELVKTYSGLFFDLLILFVLSVIFLLVRGYYSEEASRIDTTLSPDPKLFLPLQASSIKVELDNTHFFQRHGAMAAILDALPLDQSDFFLAHAGSLDIPKLTLLSIENSENGCISLKLGTAAFKEFFFSHHFADYALSRSSSNDAGKKDTLRTLFAPMYSDSYRLFFTKAANKLELLNYTPNTMGITGCVRVICGAKTAYFLQRRGHHESAARNVLHLSYAGTLNAFPNYLRRDQPVTLDLLADDEFEDEFMSAQPGAILKQHGASGQHKHELVGICANSQYLFQPELFVLTTITVDNEELVDQLLREFAPGKNNPFWAIPSLDTLPEHLSKTRGKLRPLCQTALDVIYLPRLNAI